MSEQVLISYPKNRYIPKMHDAAFHRGACRRNRDGSISLKFTIDNRSFDLLIGSIDALEFAEFLLSLAAEEDTN